MKLCRGLSIPQPDRTTLGERTCQIRRIWRIPQITCQFVEHRKFITRPFCIYLRPVIGVNPTLGFWLPLLVILMATFFLLWVAWREYPLVTTHSMKGICHPIWLSRAAILSDMA